MNGHSPHSAAYEARIREARREENERCAKIADALWSELDTNPSAPPFDDQRARSYAIVARKIRRTFTEEACGSVCESPGDLQRRIRDLESIVSDAKAVLKRVLGFAQPPLSGNPDIVRMDWDDTEVSLTYCAAREAHMILAGATAKPILDGHHDADPRRF